MSAPAVGQRVRYQNERGEWSEGQVWALGATAGTYWVVGDDQRPCARASSDLLAPSMHVGSTQDVLPGSVPATSGMHTQHTQELLL